MIAISEAQRIVLEHIQLLQLEEVPLFEGMGRVLAEDLQAPWDIPAADNSAMDGYAFSHAALEGNRLDVTGFLPAGAVRHAPVAGGEAVRIMTGAPIPSGCDTVVPFEEVEVDGDTIRLKREIRAGSHIRRKGDDVTAGARAIAAGTVLRPQEIGVLASLGKTLVKVLRRPAIAVLATGDELADPGSLPVPGQTMNCNSYSIAAQILETGATPNLLGIARDDKEATLEKFRSGLQADVLVTTGGVSVGDKDFVKDVILELGGEIKFWKVNMKPGKPVVFALVNGKPVFGLPGNPVAAMVAFEQFVRPAILRMMGHSRILRPRVTARVEVPLSNKGDRPHLITCQTQLRDGRYFATSTGSQSSSRLTSLTEGNGLLELAPGASLAPGDEAEVMLLDRGFEMGELCHGTY